MSNFKIIKSKEIAEGQGAKVKRLFPTRNHPSYHDPFVLIDEFFVESPASFPMHEHKGFEALTYMLEGSFIHNDNLGNNSEVREGGLQTFNAGKSIIHAEKPGKTGFSHGIQVWVNLPKYKKQSDPSYKKIEATKILKDDDEITVRKILGIDILVKLNTDIEYYHIHMKKKGSYNQSINHDHNGLIYVIKGSFNVDQFDDDINESEALLFENINDIKINTENDTQYIVLTGKPLNQKITIKGSFVE